MKILTRSKAALLLILLVAGIWRFWLIQSDKVAFSSDEAVVGLMARHITDGEPIPTFYYGQAYMGSLDAILTAAGFLIIGASVEAVRVVQMGLYLLSLFAAYQLAFTMTRRPIIALITTLLLAIPTMLGTVYTTITLGGYNELVLFGTLILLLGWQVTVEDSRQAWRWMLLGVISGIAWWTNGAIITPLLLVGLMGLRYFSVSRWHLYLLAAIMFLIGSAPWWVHNFQHDWAALNFLLNQEPPPGVEPLSFPMKIIAFFIIGLSGLYGFRFPWEAEFQTGILPLLALIVYIALFSRLLSRLYARWRYQQPLNTADAAKWVWLGFAIMGLIFMLSPFQDATGRYLMPLWVLAAIGIALALADIRYELAAAALGILLAFQFSTVWQSAHSEVGLEPQLASGLQADPRHDAALLDFMQQQGYEYGYASYWVSYRLMFKAEEKIIFDTSLPYDENGYRTHNNRYMPYVEKVAQADHVVWITQNFPELDAVIVQKLAQAGITYQTRDFGPYHVYYDFSERVAPADFGLNSIEPLSKLQ